MRERLRQNGLSIVLFGLFLLSWIGQSVTGHLYDNQQRRQHGDPPKSYGDYIAGDGFLEATMENWESEFLQICAYVVLTAFLYQKGSAESKDPDKDEAVDRDPRPSRDDPNVPGPVRRGGLALKLYENSLGIATGLLFLGSFFLHAVGGAGEYSRERMEHGESAVSTLEYFGTSRFWHESFQNWQSEFLSIAVVVVLSIWLRQKGSPESKPVDAPHSQTGTG
jgi:hypothetical protein